MYAACAGGGRESFMEPANGEGEPEGRMEIALTGNDVWIAGREMDDLGELTRMEIAKHIWDSRHDSKVTGFEYARARGTRNMMDPARPELGPPRGRTAVRACWDADGLRVSAECHGRDDGDDRLVVVIRPDDGDPWRFTCRPDGRVSLSKGKEYALGSGGEAVDSVVYEVSACADGWTASLTVPWTALALRPRPGMELPFNIVRMKEWADVPAPDMLTDGYVVNGLTRIGHGLEVSTLSSSIRYPVIQDPLQSDRLGTLVLSPKLSLENFRLVDEGLSRKVVRCDLAHLAALPERLDLSVAMVDPYGRSARWSNQVVRGARVEVVLPYVLGMRRGFLYPYRLELTIADPETGAVLARRTCPFLPPETVRLDALERDHEQRGMGRFRLAGRGVEGSSWRVGLVNDAGETLDRGTLSAASDVTEFEVAIGEVLRGRYVLRLTPADGETAGCVECICRVMGRRCRPSVLLTAEDVARLRSGVRQGGLEPHYAEMKAGVDEVLERGTITEHGWIPTGVQAHEVAIDDAFLASDELLMQGYAEDTLFQRDPHLMMAAALVGLIEEDERYKDLARRMAHVLADHVLWGDPRVYGADPDFMWKAMFCALVVDWIGDTFEADERRSLCDALIDNGLLVYLWSMENDAAYWKGHAHNLTSVADAMAAALALCLRDESPDADLVLAMAREDIQTPIRALPPDGSWPESVNYWGGFLHGLIFYAAALETATGTDDGVFALPGVRNAGTFPMYFTPRGVPAGYNDGMNAGAWPFLHLVAGRYGQAAWSHWAEAYAGTAADGYNRASDWYTVLWRSAEVDYGGRAEATEVGDLPAPALLASGMSLETLKVYEEIRWAALASSWPAPELYVSFKSGYAMPGFGHMSLDLNAIQVVAGGEPLIRRSHSYGTPAEGYSTVLVDGRPQGQGAGTFLYWDETDRYRTIAAEADRSFGENVHVLRRHLTMVDGRYLVVLDEVEASEPVALTAMVHTAGEVEIGSGRYRIRGKATSLAVVYAAPAVEITTLEPPPSVMEQLTTQAIHARTAPRVRTELVTVIWPEDDDVACRWDEGILQVDRPDGRRDCLRFGDRDGTYGLAELV